MIGIESVVGLSNPYEVCIHSSQTIFPISFIRLHILINTEIPRNLTANPNESEGEAIRLPLLRPQPRLSRRIQGRGQRLDLLDLAGKHITA
ncbi:MAG: hypothetical protein QME25_07040 [Bacteroidota bacterium]|nr:hypothetical protein [Bacteroidota bacterium]